MNLKEIIYTKQFQHDTLYKLLNVADRPDWLEGILDILKEELDILKEESEDLCVKEGLCVKELEKSKILTKFIVEELTPFLQDMTDDEEKDDINEDTSPEEIVRKLRFIMRSIEEKPKKSTPKKVTIGGIECPCD